MHTRLFTAFVLTALTACSPANNREIAQTESQMESAALSAITPPASAERVHILGGVDLDKSVTLLGTEPFWNILFEDGRVVFSSPDSHEGWTTSDPFVMTYEGAEWHGKDMDIYLKPARCSDGMSDRGYPLKTEIHIGKSVLKGCAAATGTIANSRL